MENIETKTAHWVDKTDWLGTLAIYKYACSNCGFTIGHKPFSRADGKGDKYCAECGCKTHCGKRKGDTSIQERTLLPR